ncbi:6-phosphogluconolactonase [Bacteroidia bacterium]|nr:6-phosphogluconolactonase [Bacteroidia bacterium]
MKKQTLFLLCALAFVVFTFKKKNAPDAADEHLYLLVGAYSDGTTAGISVYDFDTQTGDFDFRSDVKGIINPSYLAVSSDEQMVYAVNETSEGAVSAFRFDKDAATLSFLNSQPANGADPCFIAVSPGQAFVATANYSGGSLSVLPLAPDGRLEPAWQVLTFDAGATHHIHTVRFVGGVGSNVLATDLGADKIYIFNSRFELLKTVDTPPKSGPRHIAFHPEGKFLYVINELSGTVLAYSHEEGVIAKQIQEIASDITPGAGGKGSADIHISPDGQFLYASNRLTADGIAIFRIDPANGTLARVGEQPTGIHPRNFILTPNGKFLLCANRNSNNIQLFAVNPETGLLQDTGKVIKMSKPVCLKWIKH